ncbi:ENTH-domain-containing protein, partial [Gonapodya prolifera JEL478]
VEPTDGRLPSTQKDATNNEAWGASSTLMLEICEGTMRGSPDAFNEIMDNIYKRFSEPREKWRCIYKALTLLEYLVKNGSERCVDNARDHIYAIKVLKEFQFVDDKAKDQGLNVRNRAREIVDLLGDTERIKFERKKARENRNKYTGVGSDSMRSGGGGGGGGTRYGGFGSDSYRSGGGASGFRDDEDQNSGNGSSRRSPSPTQPEPPKP